jgi:hypothetical protein
MRTYRRKRERGTVPVETYMQAVKEVLTKACSLRKPSSAKYVPADSTLYYCPSTKDARSLANQYTDKNNSTIPAAWCDKQHASCD